MEGTLIADAFRLLDSPEHQRTIRLSDPKTIFSPNTAPAVLTLFGPSATRWIQCRWQLHRLLRPESKELLRAVARACADSLIAEAKLFEFAGCFSHGFSSAMGIAALEGSGFMTESS